MLDWPPIRTDDPLIASITSSKGIKTDNLIGGNREVSGIIDTLRIHNSTILFLLTSGSKQELYSNILRVSFSPGRHMPDTFLEKVEKIFLGLGGGVISKHHYDEIYRVLLKASKKTFLKYIGKKKDKYLIAVASPKTQSKFFIYQGRIEFIKNGVLYTFSMDGNFANIKISQAV